MELTLKAQTNRDEPTVNYLDLGSPGAPVIVFIHGFPFNKSMWLEQADALKAHYRVIAYDVRGHGESDSGEETFSIDLFAQDLIALMDALKIKKATICGLSMGGYIALNAITSYSDRFDGLILCDTTCKADTPAGREKRMKTILSVEAKGQEAFANEIIKKLVSPAAIKTRKPEVAKIKDMIIETPVQSIVRTLHALAERKETCSLLKTIKVPVLIIVGELDEITPVADSKQLQDRIYGSKLAIIKEAGHVSNAENPAVFNTLVAQFLAHVYPKYSIKS